MRSAKSIGWRCKCAMLTPRMGFRSIPMRRVEAVFPGLQTISGPRYGLENGNRVLGGMASKPSLLLGVREMSSDSMELPGSALVLGMPALSPTMTHGGISKWNVQEGQSFEAGDALCEVETDKATVDFEAVDSGILAKILIKQGTPDVSIGEPVAIVVENETDLAKLKGMDFSSLSKTKPDVDQASPSTAKTTDHGTSVKMSPAARHWLESYGVNPSTVKGSGKHGLITKGDALLATKGKSLAHQEDWKVSTEEKKQFPSPRADMVQSPPLTTPSSSEDGLPTPRSMEYTDEQANNIRKVIASRLTASKRDVPHFYASIDCEIDQVLEFRKSVKELLGVSPSVNDMIIRAVALSIRDVPAMNVKMQPDGTVVSNDSIDISVAVATPNGLITPIVKDADKKGVIQIKEEMGDLAARARENKLKLEEFQGGCFSVSNLGMFGVDNFTAVINPPQSAIMAVGGGVKKYVLSENAEEPYSESDFQPNTIMTVALSCDRRVVDDYVAAHFLQCFRSYMSNPKLLNL